MPIGKRIDNSADDYIEKPPAPTKSKKEEKKEELVFIPEDPKYSLDDIILPKDVKDKILDIVEYNENSEKVFKIWGLEKTHKYSKRIGINLYGESGTGKTMAAHAIANYLKRKILLVNYADIESKYVGETPKNIRRVFEVGKESKSIIFFDEADAILSKRVTNMSNATDVSVNQTRSVMLMLMNEYQDFIIFATNFIQNFDPAFMRRISMHVEFKLPDLECRKQLWNMYIPKEMPNNVNIDEISEKFDGISGSDISNAVLNSAFKAARRKLDIVDKELFYEAVNDILASKEANKKQIIGKTTVKKEEISESEVPKDILESVKKDEKGSEK